MLGYCYLTTSIKLSIIASIITVLFLYIWQKIFDVACVSKFSFNFCFQPSGKGKYVFDIGCEQHGEYLGIEQVCFFFLGGGAYQSEQQQNF